MILGPEQVYVVMLCGRTQPYLSGRRIGYLGVFVISKNSGNFVFFILQDATCTTFKKISCNKERQKQLADQQMLSMKKRKCMILITKKKENKK